MFEKILIILATSFIFYFRTLKYGAVSDDIPSLKNPHPFKNKLHKFYLRIFEGHKYNIAQDHLITLIIHTMVSVMIYLAFGKNNISFLAALLFCVNPANNQVSIWVSGRSYAMTALLLLTAVAVPILSPFCLFAAVYNPSGFFSPLAFIGSVWWPYAAMLPILWLIHKKRISGMVKERTSTQSLPSDMRITPRKFIVAIKMVAWYFTFCLIPFKLAFYHSFMESMSGDDISQKRAYRLDKFFYIGLGLIAFMVYSLWNWTATSWGAWWFIAAIAPFCNMIRMNQEIGERYAYVANVGAMYALANLIVNYPPAIAAFLTFYVTRLIYYMPAYTDDYWLIEYSVMEDPRSWFGWHIRGHKRYERGSIQECLSMWVMARMMCPKSFKITFNLGIVLRLLNKKKESDEFLALARKYIVPGQEAYSENLFKDVSEGKLPILI